MFQTGDSLEAPKSPRIIRPRPPVDLNHETSQLKKGQKFLKHQGIAQRCLKAPQKDASSATMGFKP